MPDGLANPVRLPGLIAFALKITHRDTPSRVLIHSLKRQAHELFRQYYPFLGCAFPRCED